MFKNRLLRALLAPFFMFAVADEGGGDTAVVDRGDTLEPPAAPVIEDLKNPMLDDEEALKRLTA